MCGTGRIGNRILACMDMDVAAVLRKRAQQWLLISDLMYLTQDGQKEMFISLSTERVRKNTTWLAD